MADQLGSAVLTLSVDDRQLQAGFQAAQTKAASAGRAIDQAFTPTGRTIETAANGLQYFIDAQGRARDATGKYLSVAERQAAGIGAIGASASNAAGVINNAFSGLGGTLRSLAGIAGVVGISAITQQIIATGQASERSKIQLQALAGAYGEAKGAAEAVGRIQRVLGISALDAREGFAQLYAALRGTGIGLQQLEVLFVGISNAARLSGAGTQEAQAALLQLKQGLASGTLQGDELRSVLEQLPAFAQAVADQLGVNVGRLRQLGSDGKITSDIVFNAAKQLATAVTPGRTQIEQLGIAFTNLKETAAEAFGPGLASVIANISAGITAFSRFVSDNQKVLSNFGKSVVEIGKSLVPLAAGIMAVRAAFAAYQLAAKGAAVAQAAVLALAGPKGWAVLAAAVGATALAAAGLEKVMAGVEGATKGAKAEAQKAMEAFKAVLGDTTLKPADSRKEMEVWAKKIAAANKLLDIQEQIGIESQRGNLDANAIGALQSLASLRSAMRAEQDAQAKLRSEPNKNELINASREAAENTKLAAAKAKNDLIDAFKAAQDAVRTISRGIEDSTSQLLRLQGGNEGLNQYLSGRALQYNQQIAFDQLLPQFRRAKELAAQAAEENGNYGAARQFRGLEFSGTLQGVNKAMSDFISAQRTQDRLLQDIAASNKELIKANSSLEVVLKLLNDNSFKMNETNNRLASSIEVLAAKDWNVQVNVASDGSTSAYGDLVNGAVTR